MQPWCTACGSRDDLTADHIISLSEDPTLAHEILNVQVLCRPCNSSRGDRCTDEARQRVHDAIKACKERRAKYYLRELNEAEHRSR
jgi:5-methylcytosine-specific restriction endonuclease McrA